MWNCEGCGHCNSDNFDVCGKCGSKKGENLRKKKRGMSLKTAVIATFVVVIAGMAMHLAAPKGSNPKILASDVSSSAPATQTVQETIPTTTQTLLETSAQPEEPLIYGYDMTVAEFEQEYAHFFETAGSWTMETAPQMLGDFPLFPISFLELCYPIRVVHEEVMIEGNALTWDPEVTWLLPPAGTGMEYRREFAYVDNNQNAWVRIPFDSIGNNAYTVQLPEDVWKASHDSFQVSVDGSCSFGTWRESIGVSYSIADKQITGVSGIDLNIYNGESCVNWCYNVRYGEIWVDIYSYSNGRVWFMTYDMESNELVGMSK